MPLGIVSDEDFQSELADSSSDRGMGVIEALPTAGRSVGDVNVPNALRNLIGITNTEEGRKDALQLAEQFGISPSSVSAYGQGATSTSTLDKKTNVTVIRESRQRLAAKAKRILKKSLNHITDEKLSEVKPIELAQIARSMSAIVKEMEPEVDNDAEKDKPQFVVFAPTVKVEQHYDRIRVRE